MNKGTKLLFETTEKIAKTVWETPGVEQLVAEGRLNVEIKMVNNKRIEVKVSAKDRKKYIPED